MASTYSTDLSLELVATGEKAGLWGTIQNTNLQILQTASSGYATVALSTGNVTLSLADGDAGANGKNIFLKLTGTLVGNCTVTMPATTSGGNANRVFFIEDATSRTTTNYTIGVLTTGQATATAVPVGSNLLLVSDGANTLTSIKMLNKGYNSISDSNSPYLAVAEDQLIVDTRTNPVTVTLPAAATVGDEIVVIDGYNSFLSNNCTLANNGLNILGAASNVVLNTNRQAITLVYVNATQGWTYKTNTV
jgi:hypothetical protein|tara:strand:- start:1146 stop:1892 length:747 start_codon:yes stop_codon:yes gene_type:complete